MFGAAILNDAIGRGIEGMARFIELAGSEPAASRDDRQLIERIAVGDELAFRALYARHNLRIHRFLRRLLRNPAAAEDVLSEVFLDAWRQASRYEGRSTVNTWLCGIARNKALEFLRKYPPAAEHADLPEIADSSDTPEVAAQGVEIIALAPGNSTAITTGTSVAAAHISGLAALAMERAIKINAEDFRKILKESASKLQAPANSVGAGRADAMTLVDEAAKLDPNLTAQQ